MSYKNKIKNQLYQREWNKRNPEKRREYDKKWQSANIDKRRIYDKKRYKIRKEKRKEYLKEYNRKYSKKRLENQKRRYILDVHFKLSRLLRKRLWKALNTNQKTGSAVRDLGCTIPELKLHLESQFQPGMTWENWSSSGWHIDHRLPLASFDLTDKEQFLQACHYTNLQPLWAKENIRKSDTLFF